MIGPYIVTLCIKFLIGGFVYALARHHYDNKF